MKTYIQTKIKAFLFYLNVEQIQMFSLLQEIYSQKKQKNQNQNQYSLYHQKKMNNKIPIWQHKHKQLQAFQQKNLTHPQNICIPSSTSQLQMCLIYSDQYYQILTTSPDQSHRNYGNKQKDRDREGWEYFSGGGLGNLGSFSKYSLIFDKNDNKVICLQANIYAIVCIEGQYFIFMDDINTRYKVHRIKIEQFSEVIIKICKFYDTSPRTFKNKQKTIQKNSPKAEQQSNCKDTQITPLRKINPYINIHNNMIYILGYRTVHPWQITSPIWIYRCDNDQWKQINLRTDQKIDKNGVNVVNYNSITKQKDKIGGDQSKDWIIMIDQILIIIGSISIKACYLKNNEGQVKNIQYVTIPFFEEKQQQLFQPSIDTFMSCKYKNQQETGVLILTKPKYQQRSPILFHILISHQQKEPSITHTTSTTSQNKSTIKQTAQSTKQTKSCISYNNMKNTKKMIKVDNVQYYVYVQRLDIGVFLFNTYMGYGVNSNTNRSFSTSCYSSNSNVSEGRSLWDVVNDIVYIQIEDASINPHNHAHNMTSTNFIKKTQQQNSRSHQVGKKTKIVNLYTRTKVNNPSCIQLFCFSIKLSQLQPISFSENNKLLPYYFQKKEHCDLVFLAQKKEIYCSRQLFQFYSSKFKKLYSSSNNSKSDKTQAHTLVKLDHTKLSTIYFLVQQLYHGFSISLTDFDQSTLIDLMILSHKFQVTQLQALCEQQIKFSCDNFSKLYDYFRNSETVQFRQQFLKFFIIHAQEIIKMMPIGKVQQLIRLVYSPQCIHTNCTQIRARLQNNYSVKDTESGQVKQINKSINYAGIIKGQQITLKICLKCHRLQGYNHENHKKNKSSVRGNSLGSFGHKKKDNNSN